VQPLVNERLLFIKMHGATVKTTKQFLRNLKMTAQMSVANFQFRSNQAIALATT
jgi:hypothetical protein